MEISDINSLRCLVMLVDEGSVSKVAQKSQLSQPAVSQILKKLREIFNDPIVVNSKGRMIATPRGERLAEECRNILSSIKQLQSTNAHFNHLNYDGKFVISAPEYVDHLLTPFIYRELSTQNSSISLHVKPPNPLSAESELSSGEIDLRIGWVDKINLNTRSKFLYNESFLCVAKKNHPIIGKSLTLEKFCLLPHARHQSSVPSTASRTIDREISRLKKRITSPIIVPSLLSLGKVVEESNVISCLPYKTAKLLTSVYSLQDHIIPINLPMLKIAMYWHEKMHNDKRHSWLRRSITEAVKKMQSGSL